MLVWLSEDTFQKPVLSFHVVEAGSVSLFPALLYAPGWLGPRPSGQEPVSTSHLLIGLLGLQMQAPHQLFT